MIGIVLSIFFGYRKSQRWGKTFFKLSLLPITVFYQSMLPEYQEAKKGKEVFQKASL
jgi:IS1 family transposase